MLFYKKGQSTVEYSIAFATVVALAAGVLAVAFKGGAKAQEEKALYFLADAGSAYSEFYSPTSTDKKMYGQEWAKTTVDAADFTDKTTMRQGGSIVSQQIQTSETQRVVVETLDEIE
ncbi:MAG: hypothetical protein ISS45_02275 [Candidatus Omnitrophica bacterium]|nr:hypothetical protein [Candidatus Omnitrophota bacterium]